MKLYKAMRTGENLGWCRCFISDDGNKAISVNSGEVESTFNINNLAMMCKPSKVIEAENLHECGCAECPFRDDCEAMVIDNDI